MYNLYLIRSRKFSWSHVGSNPTIPTIEVNTQIIRKGNSSSMRILLKTNRAAMHVVGFLTFPQICELSLIGRAVDSKSARCAFESYSSCK